MKIRCYGCGRTLDVPDDIVEGQHVKCMHCGTKFAYSLRSACAISELETISDRCDDMLIKCQHCGKKIVVNADLVAGQHVWCPYCDSKFTYLKDGVAPNDKESSAGEGSAAEERVEGDGQGKSNAVRKDERCVKGRRRPPDRTIRKIWGLKVVVLSQAIASLMTLAVFLMYVIHKIDEGKTCELRNNLAVYISVNSHMLCVRTLAVSRILRDCGVSLEKTTANGGDVRLLNARIATYQKALSEVEEVQKDFADISGRLDVLGAEELKAARQELMKKVENPAIWRNDVSPVFDLLLPEPPRPPVRKSAISVQRQDQSEVRKPCQIAPDVDVKSVKAVQSESVKDDLPIVETRREPTMENVVDRLILRLKEAKYSFDEQSIRKLDPKAQKVVLEEMWYDHMKRAKK